jgi:hypothetical protein
MSTSATDLAIGDIITTADPQNIREVIVASVVRSTAHVRYRAHSVCAGRGFASKLLFIHTGLQPGV